ncbi:hypothetical protein J3169_004407 [Salmonella enterica]|nr:hypothetical protein [Salmonella enterica]
MKKRSVLINDFTARALGRTGINKGARVAASDDDYTPTARSAEERSAQNTAAATREANNITRAMVFYRQAYYKTKRIEAARAHATNTADETHHWKKPAPPRR